MKILWLHQYFATPKGWGAVRTYEFARRFVKDGHAVDVVCCAGYDASLKNAGCRGLVKIDGMRVFVSGTAYRSHMGFVRRMCSFLRFMTYALWFVVRNGRAYDVVIASSGPLTMAVPALAGRWLHHLPFVFEVIDVWPDSAIAAGVLNNSVLKWLSFKLESFAYKYASAIVTCSTGMTERVKKKLEVEGGQMIGNGETSRIPALRTNELTQVVTLSNCCDLEQFVPNAEQRRLTRERLGVRDDQTVVLYTGAMGLSNAVEDLVEAVRETVGDERIVWWFAGSGPRSALLRECESSNVERGGAIGKRQAASSRGEASNKPNLQTNERMNSRTNDLLHWFGCLPKEEVVKLYLAADVNVITFMHKPLFYENSPNKFFDGIAAGLPAVFNRTTWLEPWLEQYECGIVCKHDEPGREMAEALRSLASDRERLKQMGLGARLLAEEVFSRDKLAVEYLEILRKIAR